MKFEVRYPDKPPQELELEGPLLVVGRDPSADIVLHDVKCSRKHAVLEDTVDGLLIRDTGSANGVYVNGRRVERSDLRNGDLVRLGEVQLLVVSDTSGTVAMAADEIEEIERQAPEVIDLTDDLPVEPGVDRPTAPIPEVTPAMLASPPRPAARPRTAEPRPAAPSRPAPSKTPGASPRPAPRPVSAPSRPSGSVPPRPRAAPPRTGAPQGGGAAEPSSSAGLMTLSVLWALGAPASVAGSLLAAWWMQWRGTPLVLAVTVGLVLGITSAVLALGLWNRQPWARSLQIVVAILGLAVCPFTLVFVAVLIYMLGPAGRAQFAPPRGGAPREPSPNEPLFAATFLGTTALGVLLTLLAVFLATRTGLAHGGGGDGEMAAVQRLERLAAAERHYEAGTCPGTFGDLDSLLRPASAIPNYPADGPAFLPADYAAAEAGGYRYALTMAEPSECPSRGFRRFTYRATPVGSGRHLVVGPDGVVRAAEGRPARAEDPAAR